MAPQDWFGPDVATTYDDDSAARFTAEHLALETGFLAELAGPGGRALEFAVGTGRVALPLRERGVAVSGIDLSTAMLGELAAKPGGSEIPVTCGDFSTTVVGSDFDLVRLGPDGRGRRRSIPLRYTWPAELDLMARLAGMTLRERWAWWDRTPFSGRSEAHVSVWTTAPQPSPLPPLSPSS